MKKIPELLKYSELIKNLYHKGISLKYKGSILGFLWSFINPAMQLLIYVVAFSNILKIDDSTYGIYVFIGLIPWLFFSNSLTFGAQSIINSKDLIKKVYFPREVIPISAVIIELINMLITMIIIFIALIFFKVGFSVNMLFLPIIILVQLFFTVGIVLIFSALMVFFRDTQHIINIFTMALIYFTPIFYKVEMLGKDFERMIRLNPLTGIIDGYRQVLLYKQAPNIYTLAILFGASLGIFFIGYFIFKKTEKKFAEVL